MPTRSSDTAVSDTETQILEAAHRVFIRRGTAGARTQEIADEAGVNKALLHYYFRTKERLAEAIFLRAARTLFPQLLQVLASDLPLRDKLQQAVEAELAILEANPYLPGYIISEFQYRPDYFRDVLVGALPVDAVRRAVFDKIQTQLNAEADAGRLRPTRAEDFIVALMAQLVFPYAAAPMLETLLGLDEADRHAMMERRREHLADAILRSFSP